MLLKFIKFFIVASLFFIMPISAMAIEKPVVFVSILPQKYFVEQLAGDLVSVDVMVPPGASPATYEPKPSQMVRLAKAKAYYSIGVPFETAWLPRLHSVTPDIVLVATDSRIQKRPIDFHSHHNGQENGAAHRAIADPHIWLSPPLVKKQVEQVALSLRSLLPSHSKEINQRLTAFKAELDTLDLELKKILQGMEGVHFMVFHPSWGYFANQYGLVQEAVEFSGKSPKPTHLAKLVATARDNGIQTILVQPQFARKSAELIAKEIGGKVVVADPLAVNWAENLKKAAQLIAGGQ